MAGSPDRLAETVEIIQALDAEERRLIAKAIAQARKRAAADQK